MDTMAFPFDENLIVVNGNRDELGPTFSLSLIRKLRSLYYCHLIVAASVLHLRRAYLFAYLSDIMLMASLADILSFLFMMKRKPRQGNVV